MSRSAPDLGPVLDLGRGLLGTALRHAVLARRSGDWAQAHELTRIAATTPVTAGPQDGLFRGAPALAYVLHVAGHRAYQPASEQLDPLVDAMVEARLHAALRRMDSGRPPRLREFDLIGGLTGLAVLLLCRGRSPEPLGQVLMYLIRLLDEPLVVDDVEVPGWWSSDTPRGVPAESPATGHANFGLAHGAAGPIALLALAARAGHEVPGQLDCLRRACRFLEQHAGPRTGHSAGSGMVRWPETVVGVGAWQDPLGHVRAGKPSWCYGTPGIARALQLAATVCDLPGVRDTAESALVACLDDPAQLADDPTVCHGWAGLQLVAARATADAGTTSPLRRLDTVPAPPRATRTPHRAGLLTGPDGTLLTRDLLRPDQHATGTDAIDPAPVSWDACLLLEGTTS